MTICDDSEDDDVNNGEEVPGPAMSGISLRWTEEEETADAGVGPQSSW